MGGGGRGVDIGLFYLETPVLEEPQRETLGVRGPMMLFRVVPSIIQAPATGTHSRGTL